MLRSKHNVEDDRAKNRGRFAPLHEVAEQIVCDLVSEFQVQRTDAFGLDPELEDRCELARPSVRLAPEDTSSAPIVISFTAFPGIQMRLGHWHLMAFPACGCDACDEEVGVEIERLRNSVADVVAGRFSESIYIPRTGDAWVEAKFCAPDHWSGSRIMLDRVQAEFLLSRDGGLTFNWQRWQPRDSQVG
jgi:hypothetical protein